MIYFDNAATGGHKCRSVQRAVQKSMHNCANAGRSGHLLSVKCAETVFSVRQKLTSFLGGTKPEHTVFTKNCTEALNIAVFSALKAGGHAVVSCYEHNSVLRAVEHLASVGRITYDVCPPHEIVQRVNDRTKAVFLTLASNVTGEVFDPARLLKQLPPHVFTVADGAQAAGHVPIDMTRQRIDALCVAGHKGLGAIQGVGAILFSERFLPDPVLFGGTGSESLRLTMPDFYPDRLESGTLAYPAICSLGAGLEHLNAHFNEMRSKIYALTEHLISRLKKLRFITLYSRPNFTGIVAFRHTRYPSETVAQKLSAAGFAVRGGLHCAPLAHAHLNTQEGGLVRVSFSACNRFYETDRLLAAICSL